MLVSSNDPPSFFLRLPKFRGKFVFISQGMFNYYLYVFRNCFILLQIDHFTNKDQTFLTNRSLHFRKKKKKKKLNYGPGHHTAKSIFLESAMST